MIAGLPPEIVGPASGFSLTFAGYLVACLATLRASVRDRPANAGTWLAIFTLLGLLSINKYFDLQTHFADFMRDEAQISGWYDNRRVFQHIFFIAAVALFLLITFWIAPLMKRRGYALSIAICGAFFLTLYISVRAASLHSVDIFLGSPFLAMSMNDFLERAGIAIIGVAALTVPRSEPSDNR
ncbi:MAG: hypothetical protein QM681_19225 [Novosphingobium sp.]